MRIPKQYFKWIGSKGRNSMVDVSSNTLPKGSIQNPGVEPELCIRNSTSTQNEAKSAVSLDFYPDTNKIKVTDYLENSLKRNNSAYNTR